MFPENENIFPAKPELIQVESGSKVLKLFISMFLFFLFFILLFSDSYILVSEIIAILLIHEFGHLITMKAFGYKSLNMIFIPLLGAMVTGNKMNVSQKQKVLISLMGPLPGILLGCGLFIWAIYAVPNTFVVELSLLLMSINILNMIPLDPLDGGNIIETLFFPTRDQIKMYFTLFSSLVMIGIGVYFGFFPILIFGFFMAFKVRSFQKNKAIHDELDELEFNYKKEYKDLTDVEYWTIRRVFLNNNPKIKEVIPEGETVWENEKLIVEQVNQILKFDIKKDLSIFGKILVVLLVVFSIVFPFFLVLNNYHVVELYLKNVGF